MKILATGFEPFAGGDVNPSWMAVSRLPDDIGGHTVIKAQLPVVYFKALDVLEGLIKEHKPDMLLMSGLAGNSDAVRIERVGINLCEAPIPDNDGVTLNGEPIAKDGPCAYFSTFPYEKMLKAVKDEGIPVRYSYSAGAYLCNHILYGGLRLAKESYPFIKSAGFIHVPPVPEQVKDKPHSFSLPIEQTARAMEIFAEVMLGVK